MNKKDKTLMQVLAQEGKQISKIWENDFPGYDYWDIYDAVYGDGGKSALGVKRTIANRLITLSENKKKAERAEIIQEVEELVWHLYDSLKSSQRKLEAIRKTLDK